ncbi:unnamed protein product [Arabidopsis arenosa]|uniref:DUF4283 domain-containing protein n=1 Tax=Arabidopsis arenosa TaxID=38785 RepID=A0A8S2A2C8_ARAAE|nr:unnamed protein product [Arabidopsis arenosa]
MGPPPPLGGSSQSCSDQVVSSSKKENCTLTVADGSASALQSKPEFVVTDGVARISIPDELIADALPLWKNFVIGHFMGDVPHVGSIHATVNRIWTILEKTSKIDVQVINKTSVLFRIVNPKIRERVLKRKYWHIADIPLVVSEWNPEASQAPPDLSAMPMWVDLRGVPGNLFSHQGLELLSSTVGKFVKLHPNTERCIRLDVARVLVEVNLQAPLTETISFANEKGEEILVPVSYPWLPPKCKLCSHWGHKEKDCTAFDKIQIVSATQPTGPKKVQGDEVVDSATVKELAQSLLQDLALTPTLHLPPIVAGDKVDTPTQNQSALPQENQLTLVKSKNRSSSPVLKGKGVEPPTIPASLTGFRVLQNEGDDENGGDSELLNQNLMLSPKIRVTEAQTTVNGIAGDKEDGEIDETEEDTNASLDQVRTGKGEKQESASSLADQTMDKVPKINMGRSRSRSRGPPKPITQRKEVRVKGSKNTSSRK